MLKDLLAACCLRVAQAIQRLWVVLVAISWVDPGDLVDRAHFSRG